jgi:hypothetical protein
MEIILVQLPQGGMLSAIYAIHGQDIPHSILATTFLLVVLNCLSSFQIYSMPVFDSFEAYYTGRTNRPCSAWVRSGFRVLYGFISLFISVALPFLSSLPMLYVDPPQETREVHLCLVPKLGPWASGHRLQPCLLIGWYLEHLQQWSEV